MNCANLLGRLRRWCLFTLLLAVSMPMTSYGAVMNFTLMAKPDNFELHAVKATGYRYTTGSVVLSFPEHVNPEKTETGNVKHLRFVIRPDMSTMEPFAILTQAKNQLDTQIDKTKYEVVVVNVDGKLKAAKLQIFEKAKEGPPVILARPLIPDGLKNPSSEGDERWGTLRGQGQGAVGPGGPDVPHQFNLRTEPTPEPGSFAIMGILGLGGAAMRRWRKSKLKEPSDDSFHA